MDNTYTLASMAQVPTLLYTEVGACVGKRHGERTVVNRDVAFAPNNYAKRLTPWLMLCNQGSWRVGRVQEEE